MTDRLRLLTTTPRLPPGLLSWAGWEAARCTPVYAADPHSPVATALRAAGVNVTGLAVDDPREAARALREFARGQRGALWLAGPDGDPQLVRALGNLVARDADAELEVVFGSWDPPGARLLDVVAVMDRLRSPGGCPWDAEQTHDSLRRYLLEEAYEAYDALVDSDLGALREELGDVLLQVAFHARLAEEDEDAPWGIDDVAAALVDKLIRRHPHVFADRAVSGAPEVAANWEQIKRAEKGRTSVTEGLARSQPALSLAQALIRRAARHDLPVPDPTAGARDAAALGELLLAVVSGAEQAGLDAEAALRAASDRYADQLRAAERAVVVDYDEDWPGWFEAIRTQLVPLVGHIAADIEHVGSTAVRGLAAKPIIDVDVVVASQAEVGAAIDALEAGGFRPQGDLGVLGREAFAPRLGLPDHHLYVVVQDSQPHRDHVLLRDYLRAHPGPAGEYAAVKKQLVHLLNDDRQAYVDAKSSLVQALLQRAEREREAPPPSS